MNSLKKVRRQMAYQSNQNSSRTTSHIWSLVYLNNDLVACGSTDNSVKIINLNSNHVESILNEHKKPVVTLASNIGQRFFRFYNKLVEFERKRNSYPQTQRTHKYREFVGI